MDLFAHSEKLFNILHDTDIGPAIGLAFGLVIALAPSSGYSCGHTWAQKLSNTDGHLIVLTYTPLLLEQWYSATQGIYFTIPSLKPWAGQYNANMLYNIVGLTLHNATKDIVLLLCH